DAQITVAIMADVHRVQRIAQGLDVDPTQGRDGYTERREALRRSPRGNAELRPERRLFGGQPVFVLLDVATPLEQIERVVALRKPEVGRDRLHDLVSGAAAVELTHDALERRAIETHRSLFGQQKDPLAGDRVAKIVGFESGSDDHG